jgi:ATP-dependent DNA ligase
LLGLSPQGQSAALLQKQKAAQRKVPELVDVFRKKSLSSFVVDGEIVALQHGLSSFAKLQQRMQVQHPSEELRKKTPGMALRIRPPVRR